MSAAEEAAYLRRHPDKAASERHYMAWTITIVSLILGPVFARAFAPDYPLWPDLIGLSAFIAVGVAACPLTWLLGGAVSQIIKAANNEE